MPLRTLKQLDETEGTVRLHLGSDDHTQRSGKEDLILFPPLSDDPNDPLRWPRWRKNAAFLCVCMLAFVSNFPNSSIPPAFVVLSKEFHTDYGSMTKLLSWNILILGLASLLGATALCAIGGGSTEALGAAIVNDIFFIHERASKMSIYIICLALSNTLGPLLGGYITQGIGWRWIKGISAILSGITLIMVLMLVPETRFERLLKVETTSELQPQPAKTDSDDQVKAVDADEVEVVASRLVSIGSTSASQKKSQLQLLSLWSGVPVDSSLLGIFLRPFPLIAYPAVLWGTLAYAVALATSAMASFINPAILQAPPYNMSSGANGLINISAIIGNLIGAFIGGWCTDKVADWWSICRKGVFNPEVRLIMVTVPLIITTVGMALFGLAIDRLWAWPSFYIIMGMISVALTAVPSISMTYVSDAYFPAAAEALLLVNALKNIIAFGFIYAIVPWCLAVGYEAAFCSMAAIFAVVIAMAYPLMYFGKRIRHSTSVNWRIIIW